MYKKSLLPSWYRLGLGLPFALALLPTAVQAACNPGDVGGVWNIGSVNAGHSATLEVTVKIK